jgi:hypothetical protein
MFVHNISWRKYVYLAFCPNLLWKKMVLFK